MVRSVYDKVDKSLRKTIEREEVSPSALLITVRDGLITLSGSQNIISFIEDQNVENLTVHALFEKVNYENSSPTFCTKSAMWFPKLPTKFKGPQWKWKVAYETLKRYFNLLGFCKGGKLHFGDPQHKPYCFPDSISWESFKHPGSEKIGRINTVIEGILSYHGINVEEHHESSDNETEGGTGTTSNNHPIHNAVKGK